MLIRFSMSIVNLNSNTEDFLIWKFEAFREYLSYEVLRNAVQVLSLYDGEVFSIKNRKIIEMQNLLAFRTNKNTWLPNRSGETYLNINAEGDVYRNKGRLLTSMLLIYPKYLSDDKIKLTNFGNALAKGYVTKAEFYNFIIINYKYPHPAYSEDYERWLKNNNIFLPFIIILQLLIGLNEANLNHITTNEIAYFIYKTPRHDKINEYITKISENRAANHTITINHSDTVTRKINDILGFLIISEYILQEKRGFYSLNLKLKNIVEKCVSTAINKYIKVIT